MIRVRRNAQKSPDDGRPRAARDEGSGLNGKSGGHSLPRPNDSHRGRA